MGKGTAKITASLPNGRSAVCTVKVTTKKLPTSGYFYASTAQYTGSAIIPTVTVKDGSKVLRQNIDYRVIVTNNVKIGHANITISGMGNYYGSYTACFDIIPAKQTIISLASNVCVGTHTDVVGLIGCQTTYCQVIWLVGSEVFGSRTAHVCTGGILNVIEIGRAHV